MQNLEYMSISSTAEESDIICFNVIDCKRRVEEDEFLWCPRNGRKWRDDIACDANQPEIQTSWFHDDIRNAKLIEDDGIVVDERC